MPHRQRSFLQANIKLEMFQYLEYSRFALADISGLNFDVAYELGALHRAREVEHLEKAPSLCFRPQALATPPWWRPQ
jgi:hypothetical protein